MQKLTLALVCVCSLALAGCGEQNYGGDVSMTPAEAQDSIQKQIDAIEKNDKMPPQAKQVAIANLKARMQNASIAGKGMNGPTK